MEERHQDLSQTVNTLSREIFALARAAVERGDFAAAAARARALNDRLTEVWPRIEAAPEDIRPSLAHAWSEARLDVGYLLSGGELGTSLRLNRIVRERRGEKRDQNNRSACGRGTPGTPAQRAPGGGTRRPGAASKRPYERTARRRW